MGAFFIPYTMKTIIYFSVFLYLGLVACTSVKESGRSFRKETTIARDEAKIGDTITLESGLRYKIIREGLGKKPKPTSKVRVHYEGTLNDGTVFDSSIQRGKPLVFRLNQVIQGWQEGLLLMKEGAIYELYIPANLGYGARAAGKIPPFSPLNFTVELLEVL